MCILKKLFCITIEKSKEGPIHLPWIFSAYPVSSIYAWIDLVSGPYFDFKYLSPTATELPIAN